MICSSLNRFFTSNLLMGLDSKPFCYSNLWGRHYLPDCSITVVSRAYEVASNA